MNILGEALDAGAAKFYGPGYEDLPLQAKHHVRERVLPIFNAILPVLREGIATVMDERADSNERNDRKTTGEAFRSAASITRAWPS